MKTNELPSFLKNCAVKEDRLFIFIGKFLLSSISLLLLYYPIIWIQKYFPIIMGGRGCYGRK